jgi:hypothetical protein
VVRPEVFLRTPEGLSAHAIFDSREKYDKLPEWDKGHYQISGVLLPHQSMRIKWCPKEWQERDYSA